VGTAFSPPASLLVKLFLGTTSEGFQHPIIQTASDQIPSFRPDTHSKRLFRFDPVYQHLIRLTDQTALFYPASKIFVTDDYFRSL
jgi:hypothetical protein